MPSRLLSLCLLLLPCLAVCAQKPDFQGHRGAAGLMPENSIPSFETAVELGVTTLEMDVVISQDREVVVSHDPFLSKRFCLQANGRPVKKSKRHRLYHMPYDSIACYDCGSAFNPRFPQQKKLQVCKPLLSDVLERMDGYAESKGMALPRYCIELKSRRKNYGSRQPEPADFVALVLETIHKAGASGRVLLQSFDNNILREVRRQNPSIATLLLVANVWGVNRNVKRLGFTPDVYAPNHRLLRPQTIKNAHLRGMKVITWTVNDLARMRQVLDMGVDGIMSDYPNLFAELKEFASN